MLTFFLMIQKNEANYWTDYYKSGLAPDEPSLFAKYVMKHHAQDGQSLLELGCGNGRDARYFASNGINVLAIDQCSEEIDILIATNGQSSKLHYAAEDFTELKESKEKYDLIYSRFTLHSVDAGGQIRTIKWSSRNLKIHGKLCIETRGQKNELYKKGLRVKDEPNAFIYNDHYRRFVEFESFKKEIEASGFNIIESSEQTGFAPFDDTDYHYIRIIAQKN